MQPWERDKRKPKNKSIRKSVLTFVDDAAFAVVCSSLLYFLFARKMAKDYFSE